MADIICKSGNTYSPDDEQIILWERAYPHVDVHLELQKMAMWAMANPSKRKVNIDRFIVNWLSSENRTAQKSGDRQRTKDMTHAEMMDRGWAQ